MSIKFTLLAALVFFIMTEVNTCQSSQTAQGNFTVIGTQETGSSDFNPPPSPYIVTISDKTFSVPFEANTCSGHIKFKSNNRVAMSDISCTEACCDSDYANRLKQLMSQFNTYEQESESNILLKGPGGNVRLERIAE